MSDYDGPHRAYRLRLDLEADDTTELVDALSRIADEIDLEPERFHDRTSGGTSAGWHAQLTVDEGMTRERYFAELTAWRDKRRAERKEAPGER